MGNEEVDLVTVAVKPSAEKRSLLYKYDIPVEHLSYEYVTKCSNYKELERIVLVLRSGEEGIFPDLIDHAEKSLAKFKPKSKVLRVEQPVVTRSQLEPGDRDIIDDDITAWMNEMRGRERDLEEGKAFSSKEAIPQPEIRRTPRASLKISSEGKIGSELKKQKSIASCDYEEWDKFDADAELDRIDLRDEREQVEARDRQKMNRQKYEEAKKFSRESIVNKLTLTATELSVMAEQEKNIGNEAYRAGDYEEALMRYNSSVQINQNLNAFNNRAITNIKLGRYQDAVDDCNAVISMEYNNVTALMRRGLALEKLERISEALVDYQSILQIEPNNRIAIAGVNKLRKPSDSKKVRMKIEEESDAGHADEVKLRDNDVVRKSEAAEGRNDRCPSSGVDRSKNTDFLKNGISEICFCDRAPGSSQNPKPPPHYKGSYCLSLDSEGTGCRRREKNISRSKSQHSYFSDFKFTNGFESDKNRSKLIIEELTTSDDDCQPIESISESEFASTVCFEEEFRAGGGGDNNLVHENRNYTRRVLETRVENLDKSEVQNENDKLDSELKSKLKISAEEKIFFDLKDTEFGRSNKALDSAGDEISTKEFRAVESPYEFLRAWETLKDDVDLSLHAKLLRSLAPGDLETVVGNKLDGNMLSVILKSLERHFCESDDRGLIHRLITSLAMMPRFSIIRLFMDSNDKEVFRNILRSLENEGVVSPADISALREAYNVV